MYFIESALFIGLLLDKSSSLQLTNLFTGGDTALTTEILHSIYPDWNLIETKFRSYLH